MESLLINFSIGYTDCLVYKKVQLKGELSCTPMQVSQQYIVNMLKNHENWVKYERVESSEKPLYFPHRLVIGLLRSELKAFV